MEDTNTPQNNEESSTPENSAAGMGDNSIPSGVDQIMPEINDLVELDANQVVAKYAPEEYKILMAILNDSAALKKRYPLRVIDDAQGRAEAHALAKRANKIKLDLDRIRKQVQLPHKEKYEQIRDSFNTAIKDPITVKEGWMKGVSDYDTREAAKEAEIERKRLQDIADEAQRIEDARLAEVQRVNDENEALRRQIADMEAEKNGTAPSESDDAVENAPDQNGDSVETGADQNHGDGQTASDQNDGSGVDSTEQSNSGGDDSAPADMFGDSRPTPPPPEQPSEQPASAPQATPEPAPEPEPTPEPVPESKAPPVPEVKPELGANQKEIWFVKSINPELFNTGKLHEFYGKGQHEEALNRYVKLNKEKANIEGVVFDSRTETIIGR